MKVSGTRIMQQLEALRLFSEDPKVLTRTYLTPVHRAAGQQLIEWMTESGMQAVFDDAGNVVGRYEGSQPGLPALLICSHFDTVRNAGSYDGVYGVVAGIACVKALHDNNQRFPFAIEVIGFGDEEGVRYNATLIGSRAVAGTFDPNLLELLDADGISLADAVRAYGQDPLRISSIARKPADVLAYVELHIEQGPVLLSENLPVGIVTSIAGATRFKVMVTGMAGHAGTVPMGQRRDAAAAACEAVLYVERRCSEGDDLVGTVGNIITPGGVVNVIAGCAEFSLDIRSGDDAVRRAVIADILQKLDEIGERRHVSFTVKKSHDASSATCGTWLMQQLEASVARNDIKIRRLFSGAGHDAMAFSELTDIAMLFVRCGNGGISHHPDEIMTTEDADIAANVLLDFIRHFEPGQSRLQAS